MNIMLDRISKFFKSRTKQEKQEDNNENQQFNNIRSALEKVMEDIDSEFSNENSNEALDDKSYENIEKCISDLKKNSKRKISKKITVSDIKAVPKSDLEKIYPKTYLGADEALKTASDEFIMITCSMLGSVQHLIDIAPDKTIMNSLRAKFGRTRKKRALKKGYIYDFSKWKYLKTLGEKYIKGYDKLICLPKDVFNRIEEIERVNLSFCTDHELCLLNTTINEVEDWSFLGYRVREYISIISRSVFFERNRRNITSCCTFWD